MSYRLRIDHISLLVKSLDASAAFYTEAVGLPAIENGTGLANVRWFGVSEYQTLHITLGDTGTTYTEKATHFCLGSDDLPAVIKRLEAKGVPYTDWPGTVGKVHVRRDGTRSVYVQDPDGYWIEISDAG